MQGYLDNKKYHFIGIGGCGMSALAVFAKAQGAVVTGSDARPSPFIDRIGNIPVAIGHDAANVPADCDAVVVSSAISADNCEYQKAQELAIPIISRGRFLATVLEPKQVVAVVGSHGKTSTAALLSWIAVEGGCMCSSLVGGIMNNFDRNVVIGDSDLVITEADESDGSMELIIPDILVMLNIDDDHMQTYGSKENMMKAYARLISKVRSSVLVNAQDPELMELITPIASDKIVFFDHSDTVTAAVESISYGDDMMSIDVSIDSTLHTFKTGLRGNLFLTNMLAAIACARLLDIDISAIQSAISSYRGVKRRMEDWGIVQGVRILEDYAHHPTEIAAMLSSLKLWHQGRVICVFQPHRYTRSKQIACVLADAFANADELILTDIYTADEPPIMGITGEYVFETVARQRSNNIKYVSDYRETIDTVYSMADNGDLVVFMGAGTIGTCAPLFKQKLEQSAFLRV